MAKFNEFDIAKAVSFCWDEINDNNNRRVNATDDVLFGADRWGVDPVSTIGALAQLGRADIVAEVLDELHRRGLDFNTDMML